MTAREIRVRSEICRKCPIQCGADPLDPCSTCPDATTRIPVHEECERPAEVESKIETNAVAVIKFGPGAALKLAIEKLTGQMATGNCFCNSRARQMDKWGWLECWKRREEIYGWLMEEGRRRGIEINEATARGLIVAAWRLTRKRK